MKKQIDISIIVPVYNVEKYIKRCLLSLVNQTIKNYEILVIVDGSTDNSINIINDISKRNSNKIKVFETENKGLSAARNLGIKKSKGKYLGFVDSDDYVELNMFQKMYLCAISNDADIVMAGYFKEQNDVAKPIAINKKSNYSKNEWLINSESYACNKIFKRELFNVVQFPIGLTFEDIPVVYPLIYLAENIRYINLPLYHYNYKRDGSILSTHSHKILDLFVSLEKMNDFFKDNGVFNKYNKEICYINIKHIYNRFYDFKNYHDVRLQKKLVNEGFKHLNKNFINWRENFYFSTRKKRLTHKIYWIILIKFPNLLKFVNKVSFFLRRDVK